MRRLAGVLLVLSPLMAIGPPAQATPARQPVKVTWAPATSAIPGQYIVRFKPGARTSDVTLPAGVHPLYVYQKVVDGFAARLTPAQLSELRARPAVSAIEEDAIATALDPPVRQAGTVRRVPPTAPTTSWGLDRIDQRRLPLNRTFTVAHTGAGVTAYIIDTGLDRSNSEFTGRVVTGYSSVGDGNGTSDCVGHGTMVAGIVGGTTWGVARGVKISPVRVLGCDGTGAYSGIIAGFDWVARNAVKPAVANASLGGPRSDAANAAAGALADAGVSVSVAAGNNSGDACNISPASAPKVLTVGASTSGDTLASYSNIGSCVDVIAPGSDIVSAKRGGGSTSGSGTSFASPFATGVNALFKQAYGDYKSAAVLQWIVDSATPSVLTRVPSTTKNRLLYTAGL